MISWCSRCLGLGNLAMTSGMTQPISSTHQNLKLRRTVTNRRDDYSDDSEDDGSSVAEDCSDWPDRFVVQRQPGAVSVGPSSLPGTVIVPVQPPSTPIHRPDLESDSVDSGFLYSPTAAVSSDNTSINSSYDTNENSSISNFSTISNSISGSVVSLVSAKSSESVLPYWDPQPGSPATPSPTSTNVNRKTFRPHPMFLTPEEAARPPFQAPDKLQANAGSQDRLWLGNGMLKGMMGKKEETYAGEYLTEGQKTPVKLLSAMTMQAIAAHEARVDTKNNPVWYSFGTIVLALRYLSSSKTLEVSVVQVTELPAGKETTSIDFQVRVKPGKRTKWIKSVEPGPKHDTDSFTAHTSLKVGKVRDRSLVVSAFVSGRRAHPHLALGHALVPDLEAQALEGGNWHTFPLSLRHGSQIQDHLGMAMVALSCCERAHSLFTFTVDIMQIRNVKVQRLGSNVTTSFKAKVEVWVRAFLLVEGQQKAKYDMPSTPLVRPSGYDEQGWEAIFKHGCTISFPVQKDKINLATIVIQVRGRVHHRLATKEALLGIITLGPEELFGGSQAPAGQMDVPGDPLDSRLTQWGLAIRRMAKVDMWHRLQI